MATISKYNKNQNKFSNIFNAILTQVITKYLFHITSLASHSEISAILDVIEAVS